MWHLGVTVVIKKFLPFFFLFLTKKSHLLHAYNLSLILCCFDYHISKPFFSTFLIHMERETLTKSRNKFIHTRLLAPRVQSSITLWVTVCSQNVFELYFYWESFSVTFLVILSNKNFSRTFYESLPRDKTYWGPVLHHGSR